MFAALTRALVLGDLPAERIPVSLAFVPQQQRGQQMMMPNGQMVMMQPQMMQMQGMPMQRGVVSCDASH